MTSHSDHQHDVADGMKMKSYMEHLENSPIADTISLTHAAKPSPSPSPSPSNQPITITNMPLDHAAKPSTPSPNPKPITITPRDHYMPAASPSSVVEEKPQSKGIITPSPSPSLSARPDHQRITATSCSPNIGDRDGNDVLSPKDFNRGATQKENDDDGDGDGDEEDGAVGHNQGEERMISATAIASQEESRHRRKGDDRVLRSNTEASHHDLVRLY